MSFVEALALLSAPAVIVGWLQHLWKKKQVEVKTLNPAVKSTEIEPSNFAYETGVHVSWDIHDKSGKKTGRRNINIPITIYRST
jgi:hypothetical protein